MSDRETTAAAFAALAEAHLAAAISLTDWPQRHRLKQIQGDLSDLRDELEEWEYAPESAEPLSTDEHQWVEATRACDPAPRHVCIFCGATPATITTTEVPGRA